MTILVLISTKRLLLLSYKKKPSRLRRDGINI